jgi:Spy/CpxP family protein refolding chaperone
MTTRRQLLGGALVLLTLVNVAALATMGYGRYRHYCQMMGPDGRGAAGLMGQPGFMQSELKLTAEQEARWQPLRERFQATVARLHPALQAKRAELVQGVAAPVPDRRRIDAIVEEIQDLQTELQKECIQHMLDEKQILTPEQREKFLGAIRSRLLAEGMHPGTGSPHGMHGRH